MDQTLSNNFNRIKKITILKLNRIKLSYNLKIHLRTQSLFEQCSNNFFKV